jgi:3-oxoacyl-[acyl-carrier protein] reductase
MSIGRGPASGRELSYVDQLTQHMDEADMSELAGKVALVTGGSRGIGAAIAKRLAQGGADVAITYAGSAEKAQAVVAEIEAAGRQGVAIVADSAHAVAVVGAVERTAAEFGRLDILVNNAGIYPFGPLEEVTLEEVDRTLAIHVRAAFVAAQAAARHMGAGGRIITIGTCNVERVPGPGVTLYAMSKSALIGLTKGLARDLGPRGITVNLINPGPIDTDMNPADGPGADEERRLLALGHFGSGEDIAAMVAHLAGEGGRFVTGAAIAVDGGFAA